MKKTLLATAIAASMAATGAQAATVYDQDGTKLDVYGRLAYAVTTGGSDPAGGEKENGSEFIDLGSRFGFRASNEVSSDMTVYARMEFRGKADAQNGNSAEDLDSSDPSVDFGGFDTIRNTYVGVNSKTWGDVMVGNFDSVYYRSGDVVFDVPENAGWVNLGGISAGSRGDSISYSTPNLSGFRAHVQAKHLSGNGADEGAQDNSSTWTTAAAVDYTINDLYLSLAYNQGKDVSDVGASHDSGNGEGFDAGEDLVGFFAQYGVTDALSLRFKYEEITDTFDNVTDIEAMESVLGLGATYDYGMGDIYGQYARVEMAADGVKDQNRWVLGASYKFSQPMYVFAEIYDEDFDTDQSVNQVDDDLLTTVGVRYDF